jgi:conjugative transfer region protein TrbK
MDEKMLIRLGAVVFVAVAITVAVIDLTRPRPAPVEPGLPRDLAGSVLPLRDELYRCQRLGEDGGRDPACLKAWAENRDRFLGKTPSLPSSASSEGR